MKRWLWFFLSVLISTGVYFTIRYGLRPKPIPMLNATEFSAPQEIGAVVYRRLRQEIRAERFLVLGSSIEQQAYAEIWTGLLKTAMGDQVKIPVIFQREGLSPAQPTDSPLEVISFTEAMVRSGELISQVKARMGAGHLVVIHALTGEVSHLFKDSLSRELDSAANHPVLSISSLALGLQPEEIEVLKAKCLDTTTAGSFRIECAKARVSKIMLKKKLAANHYWAVMERYGLKEYLLFVHR